MSCPSWNRFGDARDIPETELSEAMRDHAVRCPDCYPRAVRLDPTIAFKRLPKVTVSTDDIESMKQAVAAMRRGRAVGGETIAIGRAPEPLTHRSTRWPARATLLRAAAVATVVVGGGIGLLSPWNRLAAPDSQSVAAIGEEARSSRLPETTIGADPAIRAATTAHARFARGPLIENVRGFEVIQMAYDDLDLVVLVDTTQEVSTLDV
jgi:hypothetical protein